MHIPDGMMNGAVCPVTAALSVAGIGVAAYAATRPDARRVGATHFAAVSALVFAGQMLNFPISGGTSGHLVGGVLAAALLGAPAAVLSIALVVTLQCLAFGDGGVTALGANLFNMAILGAGVSGLLLESLQRALPTRARLAAVAVAAWASLMLAAFACSAQLVLSAHGAWEVVLPAMLSVHAWIGLGELALSVLAVWAFARSSAPEAETAPVTAGPTIVAAGVLAALASPFASALPDGLEWVAEALAIPASETPVLAGWIPDYAMPGIASDVFATGLAGLAGVALLLACGYALGRVVTPVPARAT